MIEPGCGVSLLPREPGEPVPEVTGREMTLAFGERRWRVRGLDKASSFEVLRVNVMCSAPDPAGGSAVPRRHPGPVFGPGAGGVHRGRGGRAGPGP